MIRIGIVGTGAMAGERASSFSGMDRARVAGVCSSKLAKAAALGDQFGAKAYDDYSGMLTDCDAIVICAPNNAHAELAEKALAAGKHVLVEYPLCTSMEDAESLRAASRAAGRVLMAGNTIIHEATFRYLLKNRDRLGRILSASSRAAFYSPDIAGTWFMNEEKVGPVFSALHYHHIEYYRRFLGEVEWVVSRDQCMPDEHSPGLSSLTGGVLIMGHEGGAVSSVQWYLSSLGENGLPRGMWINGTESSLTILSQEPGRSHAIWNDGGDGRVDVFDDDWGVSGSCTDFIDAIEGRLDHAMRLDSDIATLNVGIHAYIQGKVGITAMSAVLNLEREN